MVLWRLYRFHRRCHMPRGHALRRAIDNVIRQYKFNHRL